MRKHDLLIFPNGRVVFYPQEDFDKAVDEGKELLIVCNAWSGGYAHAMGAEKIEHSNGIHYECYGYEVNDIEFSEEDLKKFYKVIFSSGLMVAMESSGQATAYFHHTFVDHSSNDGTVKEMSRLMNIVDKSVEDLRKTVDSKMTVRNLLGFPRTLGDKYEEAESKVQALVDYQVCTEEAMTYFKEKYRK